jgi:phage shock protein A
MEEQKRISLDDLCQQALQAKLNLYQEREKLDVALKIYNDSMDNLIRAVDLLKRQMIEAEKNKNQGTNLT